jgi:hypothetical protein
MSRSSRTSMSSKRLVARTGVRELVLAAGFALAGAVPMVAHAEAAKPEPAGKADVAASIGGGAVARILSPAEKSKVLEDELGKEVDRRVKAEQDNARYAAENKELSASIKNSSKERAGLEARLMDAHERSEQVQRANDRLRQENERIAVTVRLALPIVALVCAAILGLLVYVFLFLRKVAERVHGQSTLVEMQKLEAHAAHLNDQYNAELKRNQTLRHKLAELGIVDDEQPHTPTGHFRTR